MLEEAYLKGYFFVPSRRLFARKVGKKAKEVKNNAVKASLVSTTVIGITGSCISARTYTTATESQCQIRTLAVEVTEDGTRSHELPKLKKKNELKPKMSIDVKELPRKEHKLMNDVEKSQESGEIPEESQELSKDFEDKSQVSETEVVELFTTDMKEWSYKPTAEELDYLYKLVYAEANDQGTVGQTMVANVVLNRVRNGGFGGHDIISVGSASGQFSPVKNGVPSVWDSKKRKWVPVSDGMISDELKAAVNMAFEQDLTIAYLKQAAESRGITNEKYWKGGALFFWAPQYCSEKALEDREGIKVSYQWNGHKFCRVWDS